MVGAQLSLLGREETSFDEAFTGLTRIELAGGAWLDRLPDWVRGHAELFDVLSSSVRWRQEQQKMYDKLVDTPRLFASLPEDGPIPPVVARMRVVLSERYGTDFERVTVALYRDGRDSVAWHGDRIARRLEDALVATVSLGGPRRFLMRPYGGGRSVPFSLGWGDLLVMGGTCQRTWQHSIPKTRHAEPRIAIMFRPVWDG
jgi:alkylated DNA repair dioxygenase AlkB